jgi:hypothetical protein
MYTSILWLSLTGAAIVLLLIYRDGSTRTEITTLHVKENLGRILHSSQGAYLAWFSIMSPPVVLTAPPEGERADNLLIFEEYPLLPVRFFGPWLASGEPVSTLIVRDEDGNPLSIEVIL